MSDKVQKIKDWVKNLKSQASTIPNLGINALAGFQLACDDVIAFINSLPKESGCEVNCTTRSEDLEESARYYLLNTHISPLNDIMHQVDLKAEMQYHKDIENAFKAGAEWQRNQMMRDAVDAFVNTYENTDDSNYVEFVTEQSPYKFKETEKCKIIIVKED